MPKFIYAGIGSRKTPLPILYVMQDFAKAVGSFSIMRSGGAEGADSAFEFGATLGNGLKEIFLPWKGFNDRTDAMLHEPTQNAMEIAEHYHPRWRYISQGAKKLHGRNTHQVLGADCETPVDMIVCWTQGAKGGGGTGQALRIAQDRGIEVWDLADPELEAKAREVIADGGIELRPDG